jgi:hypothetical protein
MDAGEFEIVGYEHGQLTCVKIRVYSRELGIEGKKSEGGSGGRRGWKKENKEKRGERGRNRKR